MFVGPFLPVELGAPRSHPRKGQLNIFPLRHVARHVERLEGRRGLSALATCHRRGRGRVADSRSAPVGGQLTGRVSDVRSRDPSPPLQATLAPT